jgi:predicted PurR-regulated permease PerM
MTDVTAQTSRWRLRLFRAWSIIGVALIVAASLWLLARISPVLTPFIFAGLVVFVLRKPVDELSSRGLPRGMAIALCYIIGAAVVTFSVIFVFPPLATQFRDFLIDFPGYYTAARDLWFDLGRQYTNLEIPLWLEEAAMASRQNLVQQLTAWSRTLAGLVVAIGGQIVGFLFNLFLSLALAFFVLRDLPTLKEEVLLLGGGKRRSELLDVIGRVTLVVEGWIKGQTLIAFIVGVLTWVGLQFLGVPYALIIGVIAGVTNLIPYLGPFVAGLVAGISAAFVSPMLVVYTVLYIIAVQQAEALFLQPRVMSEHVNLHPVLVVFSLLIGATVAGLLGMLFAVPVAGAINAVFVYYFEKRTNSTLATADGALFRKRGCDDDESDDGADGCEKIEADHEES